MQHLRIVPEGSLSSSVYFLLTAGWNAEVLTGDGAAILDCEVNIGTGAMLFRAEKRRNKTGGA